MPSKKQTLKKGELPPLLIEINKRFGLLAVNGKNKIEATAVSKAKLYNRLLIDKKIMTSIAN